MPKLARIDARLFHIPLAEVLVEAEHGDHTHFELVTASAALEDGADGTGYAYSGGHGGHPILAMVEHDLAPFLIGPDVAIMMDAKVSMSVDEAVAAARAFAPFDLLWFKEPTISGDHHGYGRIAEAMGEVLHTFHDFENASADAGVSFGWGMLDATRDLGQVPEPHRNV
jgi:L-alanine-DL-glutamate epimerase-like enolase superfamily enzyme